MQSIAQAQQARDGRIARASYEVTELLFIEISLTAHGVHIEVGVFGNQHLYRLNGTLDADLDTLLALAVAMDLRPTDFIVRSKALAKKGGHV